MTCKQGLYFAFFLCPFLKLFFDTKILFLPLPFFYSFKFEIFFQKKIDSQTPLYPSFVHPLHCTVDYCISGAPEPRVDHAVLCCHMGLAMVDAIKAVRDETRSSVDMRVGIHTGSVLAGKQSWKSGTENANESSDWSFDWSIDWLIDWLYGPLIDWLIVWSIDWLIDCMVHWLIDWAILATIQCTSIHSMNCTEDTSVLRWTIEKRACIRKYAVRKNEDVKQRKSQCSIPWGRDCMCNADRFPYQYASGVMFYYNKEEKTSSKSSIFPMDLHFCQNRAWWRPIFFMFSESGQCTTANFPTKHSNTSCFLSNFYAQILRNFLYVKRELSLLLSHTIGVWQIFFAVWHFLIYGIVRRWISAASRDDSSLTHSDQSSILFPYFLDGFCMTTSWSITIFIRSISSGVIGQRQYAYDVYSKDTKLANAMESGGIPGWEMFSVSSEIDFEFFTESLTVLLSVFDQFFVFLCFFGVRNVLSELWNRFRTF